MSKTNSLESHYPESKCSRADKMSGWTKEFKENMKNSRSSKKKLKIFLNRKRRMMLSRKFYS